MVIHEDEMEVKMVGALGSVLGKLIMPKVMEEGLKKVYFESGAVKSVYLYIDGNEITDGVNYNPYNIEDK